MFHVIKKYLKTKKKSVIGLIISIVILVGLIISIQKNSPKDVEKTQNILNEIEALSSSILEATQDFNIDELGQFNHRLVGKKFYFSEGNYVVFQGITTSDGLYDLDDKAYTLLRNPNNLKQQLVLSFNELERAIIRAYSDDIIIKFNEGQGLLNLDGKTISASIFNIKSTGLNLLYIALIIGVPGSYFLVRNISKSVSRKSDPHEAMLKLLCVELNSSYFQLDQNEPVGIVEIINDTLAIQEPKINSKEIDVMVNVEENIYLNEKQESYIRYIFTSIINQILFNSRKNGYIKIIIGNNKGEINIDISANSFGIYNKKNNFLILGKSTKIHLNDQPKLEAELDFEIKTNENLNGVSSVIISSIQTIKSHSKNNVVFLKNEKDNVKL